MSIYDSLFNAFVTILVTIEPPGLAPLFLVLTSGMNRAERGQVALRASIIGFFVLALFAIAGAVILSMFGITLPAFRVAGGLLLFYIAFEMIFETPPGPQGKERRRRDHPRPHPEHRRLPAGDPADRRPRRHLGDGAAFRLVPDAGRRRRRSSASSSPASRSPTSRLLLADRVDGFLGQTGRSILTRLLGVILAALAVQFVADGIKALMAA